MRVQPHGLPHTHDGTQGARTRNGEGQGPLGNSLHLWASRPSAAPQLQGLKQHTPFCLKQISERTQRYTVQEVPQTWLRSPYCSRTSLQKFSVHMYLPKNVTYK